jgi:hypothetical protein
MGNNHDKTNNKQTGGTRATRKNIYKVAKNNKMNGGGFLDTFFGGVEKKPIPDATPVETPVITGTPVETPVIGETPGDNKEKEGTFLSSIQDSVGQIFDADTKEEEEEEEEEQEEEEPVKSPLDTNQILLSIAGLTEEIVKLQKILLGEIVEQPSGSVPMRMSDLDSTPEQKPVVESSIGLGDQEEGEDGETLGQGDGLGSSQLNTDSVESNEEGEEGGEDGETLGQGDGLGSNQLDDTDGTMNTNELKPDSVESNEEEDNTNVGQQPGGQKKKKKNTTRRRKLFEKK